MTRRSLVSTIASTAGVLALAVLLLPGCGGTPSGTTTSSPATTATSSPTPSTGSRGSETLPEDIPLYQHAVLQDQHTTTLNGHHATTWRYLITTADITTEQVLGFYQR